MSEGAARGISSSTSAPIPSPAGDVRRARAASPPRRRRRAPCTNSSATWTGGGDPCPERIALADYLHRWLEFQRTRGIRQSERRTTSVLEASLACKPRCNIQDTTGYRRTPPDGIKSLVDLIPLGRDISQSHGTESPALH